MRDWYGMPPAHLDATRLALRQTESLRLIHESLRPQLEAPSIAAIVDRQLNGANIELIRPIVDVNRSFDEAREALLGLGARKVIEARTELGRKLYDAFRPLPDPKRWQSLLLAEVTQGSFSGFAALNSAIYDAELLGAFQLLARPTRKKSSQHRQQVPPETSETKPSDQLIEIIPAEALARLERVEFLPLRLLDEISRDPDTMHKLSPRQFEELVADLLSRLEYDNVVLTPRSGDQGRDVLAHKVVDGIPLLFAFECKRQSRSRRVGPATLRSLLGTVSHGPTKANVGVLVTTSTFTRGAQAFFLTEANVKGRDFDGVVEWLRTVEQSRRRSS